MGLITRGLLVGALVSLAACRGALDARALLVAETIARADEPLARSRTVSFEAKYARMAQSTYDFYRGNVPLYARDWGDRSLALSRSRFALDAPLARGLGDAHPENFGTLVGRDGAITFEPNDFDHAARVPYLWDLRRLSAGLVLAARLSNEGDANARSITSRSARDIAREAALAYAAAIGRYAGGAPREAVTTGAASPILEDLFQRAARDARQRDELGELSVVSEGRRTFKHLVSARGSGLGDLSGALRASIPEALRGYRASLLDPPTEDYFTVLDAARVVGAGVSSWGRVRVYVLVEGPTPDRGDDVILEVKELADPVALPWLSPGASRDVASERVLTAARGAWSRQDADPLWGTTTWLGLPMQVRAETAGAKTVRVARMTGARGTPDALRGLARQLGALVARAHAAPVPEGVSVASAIHRVIGASAEGFADEQADAAVAYADQVMVDWEGFRRVLRARGPAFGLVSGGRAAPSAEVSAFFREASPR